MKVKANRFIVSSVSVDFDAEIVETCDDGTVCLSVSDELGSLFDIYIDSEDLDDESIISDAIQEKLNEFASDYFDMWKSCM